MKRHLVFSAVLFVYLLSFSACREYRSPTDPSPSQPPSSGPPATYALSGHVFATGDGKPVGGARVEAAGHPPAFSSDDGAYRLAGIPGGLYLMKVSKEGFLDTYIHAHLGPYGTGTFDFLLARNPGGLSGSCELGGMLWVKGAAGRSAYGDAIVEILDGPQAGLRVGNDDMGMYTLLGLVPGIIQVRASSGVHSQTQVATLDAPNCRVVLNFEF